MLRLLILFVLLGLFVIWCWWTMIRMPRRSYAGPWLPLDGMEVVVRDQLRADVQKLAGEIGERNIFVANSLDRAAQYVKSQLTAAGYDVQASPYEVMKTRCENIVAEIPGGERRAEIVIVGAHYDSVSGAPGANDNASGVAVLLALARRLAGTKPARTLRWAAFANEEPPQFQTDNMGSVVYAKACRQRGDKVVAMISLETLGCYADEPGSQKYPFPFGLVYPSTGNFVAFVGNRQSADLVRRCVGTFRERVPFPCEGGALPGWVAGVGWSDHWSFWQAGYPALMVTDTAPFRYAPYHTQGDTPDQLDYERLARVALGVDKIVRELVGPWGR